MPCPILIDFIMISIEKPRQMHQIHSISRQSESSDVEELPIAIYPKRIKEITPTEYRLEPGQLKKSTVCLIMLI
jgi:hypothetical protein